MLIHLSCLLQGLLNREQQLLVLKIASHCQGEAHLALIAWSLGFINIQELDASLYNASELSGIYSSHPAKMPATQYCPCCFDQLLLHIRQSGFYWFCCHCREEMPGLNPSYRTTD
jgi:hypothetical protein